MPSYDLLFLLASMASMRTFGINGRLNIFQRSSVALPKPWTLFSTSVQRIERSKRKYATESSLPRVAQPSLWQSIVPKFMKKSNQSKLSEKSRRSKEWNPATFFIVMFLLIGSNAMQILALRNEFTAFSRRADAKIGLLKDVIERVQSGEEVDVKGLLGTGNPEKEKEWEEGMCLTRGPLTVRAVHTDDRYSYQRA